MYPDVWFPRKSPARVSSSGTLVEMGTAGYMIFGSERGNVPKSCTPGLDRVQKRVPGMSVHTASRPKITPPPGPARGYPRAGRRPRGMVHGGMVHADRCMVAWCMRTCHDVTLTMCHDAPLVIDPA